MPLSTFRRNQVCVTGSDVTIAEFGFLLSLLSPQNSLAADKASPYHGTIQIPHLYRHQLAFLKTQGHLLVCSPATWVEFAVVLLSFANVMPATLEEDRKRKRGELSCLILYCMLQSAIPLDLLIVLPNIE